MRVLKKNLSFKGCSLYISSLPNSSDHNLFCNSLLAESGDSRSAATDCLGDTAKDCDPGPEMIAETETETGDCEETTPTTCCETGSDDEVEAAGKS